MTGQQGLADLEVRARQSGGASAAVIYDLVAAMLAARGASGMLADVGCGGGHLWRTLAPSFSRCIGLDAIRYADLPEAVEFIPADLDRVPLPLPAQSADVVVAVEVVEHLENPRAFCRELARIAKPGGWVVVTTPNQLNLLSLLTLVLKGRFAAFQDVSYPAHITALLEVDLRRIAAECALEELEVRYTSQGRVPGTGIHYPARVSATFPRRLSDNLVLIGRAHG